MARNLGVSYTEKEPYYFISYNSEDEARVSQYAIELEKSSIPMWYDNGIKLGTAWENEIAEKIENCTAVIMFLSKNIFLKENSYVHKEFELATEYSQKTVYVMMLDKIKKPEVPVRFRAWWTDVTKLHCINTYEYDSPKECVQQLLKSFTVAKMENTAMMDNSKKTNFERIVYQDGASYEGEMVDGKRHGKGKLRFANGDIYEGDFVDGKITGNGEYWFANGDFYEGDFINGKRSGKGYYVWTNDDCYEGDFVDGKRTGKGRYEWANEDVYEGYFVDGQKHGKGKYTFANGEIQEGDYIDGKIFKGIVYDNNGKMIAKYVNGKRQSVR